MQSLDFSVPNSLFDSILFLSFAPFRPPVLLVVLLPLPIRHSHQLLFRSLLYRWYIFYNFLYNFNEPTSSFSIVNDVCKWLNVTYAFTMYYIFCNISWQQQNTLNALHERLYIYCVHLFLLLLFVLPPSPPPANGSPFLFLYDPLLRFFDSMHSLWPINIECE